MRALAATLRLCRCRTARLSVAWVIAAFLAGCLVCVPQARGSEELDFSGAWAEIQVMSEFARLPLVGEAARTSTVVLRVTIEQTGSSLILRETFCATEIDNGSAIAATSIPRAFLSSLGELVVEASIDASTSPARFVQPWTTEVRGARLEDPERDPLPTQADDPRVVDQDGDGKPGLTVRVSALGIFRGDVYVVQRVRTRLAGAVVSPDRIEGLIEWTTEQVTLGATNALFLGNLPSRPDPFPEHSFFILQRVDATWACEDILAHRDAVFGR
jgi:hypothetical protein